MSSRRAGSLARSHAMPTLLGAAVAFLGCAILASWYVQTLRSVTPDHSIVPMQYNTAVGFVITGLAVVAHCVGRRRLALLGGALAAGLGSMALAEQFHRNGPTLFGGAPDAGGASLSMSPNTALAFALAGCLLLVLHAPRTRRSWRRSAAGMVAAGITATGFAGLLSFALNDPATQGWARLTVMEAHTALGFLGLGTAFFVMIFRIRGDQAACSMPHWASWGVGLGVALLTLALWSSLTASDARLASMAGTRSHEAAVAHTNQVLQSHLRAVKRLGEQAALPGATRSSGLRQSARALLRDMPGLESVALLNEAGQPEWAEGALSPAEVREELAQRSELRSSLASSRRDGVTTASEPATIAGLHDDLHVFVPVLEGERSRGTLVFRHDLRSFFDAVFGSGVGRAFDVRLLTADRRMFYASNASSPAHPTALAHRSDRINTARLAFADRIFVLQGEADAAWLAGTKNAATTLVLWFGLFLAVALVFVIRTAEALRTRAATLEQATRAIESGSASLREANAHLAAQADELRQAHDDLTVAAGEKRHVLDSLSAFLIGVDARGRVTEWNSVASEEFGLQDTRVIGRRFDSLPLPWDRELVSAAINEAVAGGARVRRETVAIRAGGDDSRVVSFTINPIQTAAGRGFAIIGADVTERQQLELQLQHAQKLESVGTLAAGIAHEINTPMQFVSDNLRFVSQSVAPLLPVLGLLPGLVSAARTGQAPDADTAAKLEEAAAALDVDFLASELPSALAEMQEGVTRVTTIVRAMKDFSHPGDQSRQPADLNRAIATTLAVARNEYKYVADVETDFGDLPAVECHVADLNQVFLNLLVNGAHAIRDVVGESSGARGTIRVSTRCEGEWVEVRFSDTGGGIPEHVRDRIFDQFFTTKAVGKGTGLGLAIARAVVVEKHGGTIRFESEIGRGTTFFVRIPVSAAAGESADSAPVRADTVRSEA